MSGSWLYHTFRCTNHIISQKLHCYNLLAFVWRDAVTHQFRVVYRNGSVPFYACDTDMATNTSIWQAQHATLVHQATSKFDHKHNPNCAPPNKLTDPNWNWLATSRRTPNGLIVMVCPQYRNGKCAVGDQAFFALFGCDELPRNRRRISAEFGGFLWKFGSCHNSLSLGCGDRQQAAETGLINLHHSMFLNSELFYPTSYHNIFINSF